MKKPPSQGGQKGTLHKRQAVGHTTREGVRLVPITLTFHIFGYVVTIRVKSENRHPGR